MWLRSVVESHPGRVRSGNQDVAYAGVRLVAIADGMGGHVAGEIAARAAIHRLSPADSATPTADLRAHLSDAVAGCNRVIRSLMEADPSLRGMGTTLTALLLSGDRIGIAHVGDSRAYVLRDGRLFQLTRDDTLVQSMLEEGLITATGAAVHPRRSVLLKALQGDLVEPTVEVWPAKSKDRYLLCSDGLSDVVSAPLLESALSNGDPRSCARCLVELALRSDAPDNVTCVVADLHGGASQLFRALPGGLADADVIDRGDRC